jgi:hypothetical protein
LSAKTEAAFVGESRFGQILRINMTEASSRVGVVGRRKSRVRRVASVAKYQRSVETMKSKIRRNFYYTLFAGVYIGATLVAPRLIDMREVAEFWAAIFK